MKYHWSHLSPAWDVIPFLPLAIMQFSIFWLKCEVFELPAFVPNEYLFETHADKGNDRWEIMAWAVRDAMSKASGLETNDQHFKEKLDYEHILGYKKVKPINANKVPLLEENTQPPNLE